MEIILTQDIEGNSFCTYGGTVKEHDHDIIAGLLADRLFTSPDVIWDRAYDGAVQCQVEMGTLQSAGMTLTWDWERLSYTTMLSGVTVEVRAFAEMDEGRLAWTWSITVPGVAAVIPYNYPDLSDIIPVEFLTAREALESLQLLLSRFQLYTPTKSQTKEQPTVWDHLDL